MLLVSAGYPVYRLGVLHKSLPPNLFVVLSTFRFKFTLARTHLANNIELDMHHGFINSKVFSNLFSQRIRDCGYIPPRIRLARGLNDTHVLPTAARDLQVRPQRTASNICPGQIPKRETGSGNS